MGSNKITFRFDRASYLEKDISVVNYHVTTALQTKLAEHNIFTNRIYSPSRNSIKALFQSERQVIKVLSSRSSFESVGLSPKLSMSDKARRTIFCSGYDSTLTHTYNKEDIKQFLESTGWEVADIYIMNNKMAFKIEFQSTQQATKFLSNTNTSIGNIKLKQEHKEHEIDPTIQQCWTLAKLTQIIVHTTVHKHPDV